MFRFFLLFTFISLSFISCDKSDVSKYFDLPKQCNNSCETASTPNELRDAIVNADGMFENCICLKGNLNFSLTVSKPIVFIGEKSKETVLTLNDKTLKIVAKNSLFKDLTIQSQNSSAISLQNSENIVFDNVLIKTTLNNVQKNMISVSIENSSNIKFLNSDFKLNNNSENYLLSVFLSSSKDVLFSNSTFSSQGNLTAPLQIKNSNSILSKVDFSNFFGQGLLLQNSNVKLINVSLKNIKTLNSAIWISKGTLGAQNLTVSNISNYKSGIYGGRGIILSQNGKFTGENLNISNCDSIGILIDGANSFNLDNSTISNNSFAGLWVENFENKKGISIKNTLFSQNKAVNIQLLNSCYFSIENSQIFSAKSMEYNDKSVGDGMVVLGEKSIDKNCNIILKNLVFKDNFRSGIVVDAGNFDDENVFNGISFFNIKIEKPTKNVGKYGVVFQNGKPLDDVRSQIKFNYFEKNDKNLKTTLKLITDSQKIK